MGAVSIAGDMAEILNERARRLAIQRPRNLSKHSRVRAGRDPFDLWETPSAGSRQTAESYALALELRLVLGTGDVPAVVEGYLRGSRPVAWCKTRSDGTT